jgi:plasmid stabilization system protein ParE
MAYEVLVSPRAQYEIELAIDYYAQYSALAPNRFIKQLNNAYLLLKNNPFLVVRYKNIRSINLRKFPFTLFFVIDEKAFLVRILSCFHNRRSPIKRP